MTAPRDRLKLTEKRRHFVDILEKAAAPMSAYEIIDRYNSDYDSRVLAPSAYRILGALIDAGYVHRLETCNKYVACSHESDDCCDDEAPQFFICDGCNTVRESHVPTQVMRDLKSSGSVHGFVVHYPQIELHGLCADCA